MNKISLHAEGITDITIVPNTFIDQYMPSANGAYVKVYLYLLRCFSGNCPEVTISTIADHLENTEKDIIRSLNYWEKLNLLNLTRNEQKEITSIRLVDINNAPVAALPDDVMQITAAAEDPEVIAIGPSANVHTLKNTPAKHNYSTEQIAELKNNDEIQWAMHIIELYLERPLKPLDMQLILYLYEELHFSTELIMYLFEYCVSSKKKDISYIEAVALAWAEEGIDTEEKARETTAAYNEHYNAVNKAFGLNRTPGQIERQYINKWVGVYKFSDDIITEACNRAILRTGKPDFKYTDKILETWSKKGVKAMADIARLDEEFTKGNKIPEPGKVTPITKPTQNKFNQFPQRTYTAKDYAELERKLLNKGL